MKENNVMLHRVYVPFALLIIMPACWGPTSTSSETIEYAAYEKIEDEVPFSADGKIEAHLDADSITVQGTHEHMVRVVSEKHTMMQDELSLIEPYHMLSDKKVVIETKKKRHGVQGYMAYDIAAPSSARLALETKDGNIAIDDIAGDMKLASEKGAITIKNAHGSLDIENTSGLVDIAYAAGARGSADIETSSGNVRIEGAAGEIEIKTSSGSIYVEQVELAHEKISLESRSGSIRAKNISTSLSAETSSGSIILDVRELISDTEIKLRSETGRITVMVPRDTHMKIVARTETGAINCAFPCEGDSTAISCVIGAQQDIKNELILKTASGDITIQKK